MFWRMCVKSLFKIRNIGFLAGWFILLSIFKFASLSFRWFEIGKFINVISWMYLAGVIVYIIVAFATLYTDKFQREFLKSEKIREIRALNSKCMRLTAEVRKYINFKTQRHLKKLLKDKNEILSFMYKEKISVIGEQVIEKFLKLLATYIELLKNYSMREKDISAIDVEKVRNRITANTRKLEFEKDIDTNYNLKDSIEIDEKVIDRVKTEKIELDSLKTKLAYIESSISILKQQILANYSNNKLLVNLNDVVNEASAVEEVLDERRKNKKKI